MSAVRAADITDSNVGFTFKTVFANLSPQMAALDTFLRCQLEAFEPEIRPMVEYCLDTSGKRIRPALVFLGGWKGAGVIIPELVRAAAVVEMVHLATLVHDDIMDQAAIRRGRQTATRAYGSTAAVLLGDALFAHALNLATQFPTTAVCAAVSESTRRVCSGEIVQTLRRGTIGVSIDDYYRVIDLKTAELFRVSCRLGAKIGGYDETFVEAAANFGRHLGIAYQIYDDLADYFGSESKVGKTLGTDLESGKLTLPLIMLMQRIPQVERQELEAEILGHRPPQLSRRLRQMNEVDVFSSVSDQVARELDLAAGALTTFGVLPPTSLLLTLCDLLRGQVAALRQV
jgi:octaprenyl-diphosphate synthase